MLKRLNHIAIVVPDINKAKEIYQQKFDAVVSDPKNYPEHGVTVVFVKLENTKIELMEPYGENSPIKKFLEKNPDGGMHHICLEVSDINKSLKDLNDKKVTILGTGKPVQGSHNKQILFLHPKEFCGTLIELEEE
jgi:methylmalonyl-CoA/ethylmalonyl-CoA epimerase